MWVEFLVKQISSDWLADTSSLGQLKNALIFIRNINGQEYWAISMGMSAISYISVSLLGKTSSFNMETNKILGAIILALLLAAVFSKVADMAIHPEFPDELAYKIEVPEGGISSEIKEEVDIF